MAFQGGLGSLPGLILTFRDRLADEAKRLGISPEAAEKLAARMDVSSLDPELFAPRIVPSGIIQNSSLPAEVNIEYWGAFEPLGNLDGTDLSKRAEFHALANKVFNSGASIEQFKEAIEGLLAKVQPEARETMDRVAEEARVAPAHAHEDTPPEKALGLTAPGDLSGTFMAKAESDNIVGNAILRARTAAGLTQTQLAQRLGITQSNVARLENGRSQATTRTLQRIASASGKPITIRFDPA